MIPLASTNPVKWKATIEYLKHCPEKPDRQSNPSRCIDNSTREQHEPAHTQSSDARTPNKHQRHHDPPTSPAKGLRGLANMAKSPPATPPRRHEPQQDFAECVRQRVETDTANLAPLSIEVSKRNRFPSKQKPSQAIASLPHMDAMSDTYQTTYHVYLRKYTKLLQNIRPSSKPGKHLTSLCKALNINASPRRRPFARIAGSAAGI